MAMSRDSALITTIAEVVNLGVHLDLTNLTTDSELTAADALLEAHRWVFDRLEQNGVDPTALSNESRLKRAVAYRFLEVLHANGYLGDQADRLEYWSRQATEEVDRFRPVYSTGDTPRRAREGIPCVGHLDGQTVYSGDPGADDSDTYSEQRPGF